MTGMVLQKQGEGAERLVFRQTGADTAGELLEVEATYPSQTTFPPIHVHPEQDEHFTIISGSLTAIIGGVERTYNAGDSFDVPRGVAHTMANRGMTAANFLWETRPALQTAEFHAAIYGLEAAGGRGNILQLAPILQQHRREFVLARPPVAVQRVLFAGLTLLGRLRPTPRAQRRGDLK
ncbi:MAG TPA: cupin domain-containing protein [Thermomicrobiales bacterium]